MTRRSRVQLLNDFDRYFSGLQRRHGQSLLDYTAEHGHLYNKLSEHDVTLPNKVQGWHLLRRAGLTRQQRQLVTAQAPGMERNKVQEALLLLLGQDHKRSLEEVNMDILVTFVAKVVAMLCTMRMTSTTQTTTGRMTSTTSRCRLMEHSSSWATP